MSTIIDIADVGMVFADEYQLSVQVDILVPGRKAVNVSDNVGRKFFIVTDETGEVAEVRGNYGSLTNYLDRLMTRPPKRKFDLTRTKRGTPDVIAHEIYRVFYLPFTEIWDRLASIRDKTELAIKNSEELRDELIDLSKGAISVLKTGEIYANRRGIYLTGVVSDTSVQMNIDVAPDIARQIFSLLGKIETIQAIEETEV